MEDKETKDIIDEMMYFHSVNRHMASIQKITDIKPIPDADNIVVAQILGWQVVVKKGEFNVGDLCVYAEIDSVMPDIPIFGFLKDWGRRIKTQRMRGQVSQGICFPLSILENFGKLTNEGETIWLKDFTDNENNNWLIHEGVDVTNLMGIKKHEDVIPDDLIGKMKGYIPSAIPKSDIYRVQSLQNVLDKYKGTTCYYSEKLDGESITFYIKDNVFGVCSKLVDFIDTPESIHWNMARELDIENKLRSLNCNFSIQGEMIGVGIKKNKYKLGNRVVWLYNAISIDQHKYLNYKDFIKLMEDFGLYTVPVIDDNFILPNDINELVKISEGRSQLYDTMREGIVVCPLIEINDMIGRVVLKVISPKFLLKHGE